MTPLACLFFPQSIEEEEESQEEEEEEEESQEEEEEEEEEKEKEEEGKKESRRCMYGRYNYCSPASSIATKTRDQLLGEQEARKLPIRDESPHSASTVQPMPISSGVGQESPGE